jgi:hypothetical protein
MRKFSVLLAGTLLAAALLSVTAFKPLPPGPSANGQGGLTIGDHVQHFSFHATTDKAGVVSGTFEVKSPSQDLRLHGTITCLSILPDGKTAFMSGVITQRVGDGFPGSYNVGDFVFFGVQDNGEGANAAADTFSDLRSSGANQLCGPFPISMINIENGNIQVKP